MVCECGHQLKDHDWNFDKGVPEPCLKCDCKDFKEKREYSDDYPFIGVTWSG